MKYPEWYCAYSERVRQVFSVGHVTLVELSVTVSIVPEEGTTTRVTVRTRVSIPWWEAIVMRVAGWEISKFSTLKLGTKLSLAKVHCLEACNYVCTIITVIPLQNLLLTKLANGLHLSGFVY